MARLCTAFLAVAFALAACGQAGDLYLPSPEPEAAEQGDAAQDEASDNDNDDNREAED